VNVFDEPSTNTIETRHISIRHYPLITTKMASSMLEYENPYLGGFPVAHSEKKVCSPCLTTPKLA
jgi:hypothetical protein